MPIERGAVTYTEEDAKIREDGNACMLLLARQSLSNRPMAHQALDAISNTVIDAQFRLCAGIKTVSQYEALLSEAKAAEPVYRKALLDASESNRRALDAELRKWCVKTVGRIPTKAASQLARARIMAAEFETKGVLQRPDEMSAFLMNCFSLGRSSKFCDKRPVVECAVGITTCAAYATKPPLNPGNHSAAVCEAVCASGVILRDASSSAWFKAVEYKRSHT